MQPTTLEDLFSQPSFLLVFLAILTTIGNIIVGVSMLPRDKRKRRYWVHRLVYLATVVCYFGFLHYTGWSFNEYLFNYFVGLYFLFVIPMSRKVNVTLHAIISSVGLVLLVAVATFTLL